ncbi:hypothetical protein BCR42DRAFT_405909, partial [Absidia repens]
MGLVLVILWYCLLGQISHIVVSVSIKRRRRKGGLDDLFFNTMEKRWDRRSSTSMTTMRWRRQSILRFSCIRWSVLLLLLVIMLNGAAGHIKL